MPAQLRPAEEAAESDAQNLPSASRDQLLISPSKSQIRVAMVAIGAIQTVLVTWVVSSGGFLQDDYYFFDLARQRGFTSNGLMVSVFGSLIPGFVFVNTLFSTEHPLVQWQVEAVIVILYALIVMVFYRFLELLFGARPAIVVFTSVATCSGLLAVSLVWWTPAVNSLPTIVADLLALDGLARHALTGKRRYLVISVVAFALGTLFYDPSMTLVVVFVLFTVLFLAEGPGWRSIWAAIWSRAWVWVGFAVPVAAELLWRFLHPKEYALPKVASPHQIALFMADGWSQGFVSSLLGVDYVTLGPGAWRSGVVAISQLLLAALVVVSIVRNRSAWRAWTLFFSGFFVAALVAAIGRASLDLVLSRNSLYWCYFGFLFIVTIGLAFLPTVLPLALSLPEKSRSPTARHARPRSRFSWSNVTLVSVAGIICGLGYHYMWTTPDRSVAAANRIYTGNLRSTWSTVSASQPAAYIWDTTAPAIVLNSNFVSYNRISTTVGLVIVGLRFDPSDGPGYIAGNDGRLEPARARVISRTKGSVLVDGTGGGVCLPAATAPSRVLLPLTAPVPGGDWFLRVGHSGSSGVVGTVNGLPLRLPAGSGAVLVPVASGSDIPSVVFGLPKHPALCLVVTVEQPVPIGAQVATGVGA